EYRGGDQGLRARHLARSVVRRSLVRPRPDVQGLQVQRQGDRRVPEVPRPQQGQGRGGAEARPGGDRRDGRRQGSRQDPVAAPEEEVTAAAARPRGPEGRSRRLRRRTKVRQPSTAMLGFTMRISWLSAEEIAAARGALTANGATWDDHFGPEFAIPAIPPEGARLLDWDRITEHVARAERVSEVIRAQGLEAARARFGASQ